MAYRFGLLGYPLTHSLSPFIHRVFLEESGLTGEYELIPVAVNDQTEATLKAVLAQMRDGEVHGLNVTIPHKQTVKAWLDMLDERAEAIGAVNTIYPSGKSIIGTNTDVDGFLLDVGKRLTLSERGMALILGAGGAARAVAFGLLQAGWQVSIAARRPEQAFALIHDLSQHFSLTEEDSAQIRGLSFSELMVNGIFEGRTPRLVVNATPLGTKGYEDRSPLPVEVTFPKETVFYDLVYNPPETTFMRQARESGHCAYNGFGMLVYQAALAFEHWTGCHISVTPEIEAKIITRIEQSHD